MSDKIVSSLNGYEICDNVARAQIKSENIINIIEQAGFTKYNQYFPPTAKYNLTGINTTPLQGYKATYSYYDGCLVTVPMPSVNEYGYDLLNYSYSPSYTMQSRGVNTLISCGYEFIKNGKVTISMYLGKPTFKYISGGEDIFLDYGCPLTFNLYHICENKWTSIYSCAGAAPKSGAISTLTPGRSKSWYNVIEKNIDLSVSIGDKIQGVISVMQDAGDRLGVSVANYEWVLPSDSYFKIEYKTQEQETTTT